MDSEPVDAGRGDGRAGGVNEPCKYLSATDRDRWVEKHQAVAGTIYERASREAATQFDLTLFSFWMGGIPPRLEAEIKEP